MTTNIDCIIPFYNEGLRPLAVVDTLIKSNKLSKIIVVDDGSEDKNTYLKLKKKFPNVTVIRLEKNLGKASAIKQGLKFASSEYILLMDGDLTNILINELKNCINKIINNPGIGMIILRRIKDKTVVVSRFLRHDIIFSGQRILKRKDLEEIFEKEIVGYNLESAINTYMINNHKTVYWMPFSVHNLFKQEKWGYLKGILEIGLPAFIGFMSSPNIIYQTLFFCRKRALI